MILFNPIHEMAHIVGACAKNMLGVSESCFIWSCHGRNCTLLGGHHVGNYVSKYVSLANNFLIVYN